MENWPLNLKYVRLLARAAQRFPCYYARIMLDAFALLLFPKIFQHNYRKQAYPRRNLTEILVGDRLV